MKKLITWNFAQTPVTKIVKNHGLISRQPSILTQNLRANVTP